MSTLRALSMEKVVLEDLYPDFYPPTLVEEIQILKKVRNLAQNFHLQRNKKQCVQMLWANIRIHAGILPEENLSSNSDYDGVQLEVAQKWFAELVWIIFSEMSKIRLEGRKLLQCIPLEYQYICGKYHVNNYKTFVDETKQRLLEIIDEHSQYEPYVTRSVEQERKNARQVINSLNFAL